MFVMVKGVVRVRCQSEPQVIDCLEVNGFGVETNGDWFAAPATRDLGPADTGFAYTRPEYIRPEEVSA